MIYICHREYTGKILSAPTIVNIPVGEQFKSIGKHIATTDNGAICSITSDIAFRHFARNNDDNGLERGALTYAIAYADREVTWEEEVETVKVDEETGEPMFDNKGEPIIIKIKMQMTGRIKPAEVELIRSQYPQFLQNNAVIFTKEFFDADINILRGLVDMMNKLE